MNPLGKFDVGQPPVLLQFREDPDVDAVKLHVCGPDLRSRDPRAARQSSLPA
jgi:hypothetical protein